MNPSQSLRISANLTCIFVSVLLAALGTGFIPDPEARTFEKRSAMSAMHAQHCLHAIARRDYEALHALNETAMKHNPELASIGVRLVNGLLVDETGSHLALWQSLEHGRSTVDQLQQPIAVDGREWGALEMRFAAKSSFEWLYGIWSPIVPLLAFVGAISVPCVWFYLHRISRPWNGGSGDKAPRRVRETLDVLGEGVVVLDRNERVVIANASFSRLVDLPVAELEGRQFEDLPCHVMDIDHDSLPWIQSLRERVAQMGKALRWRDADQTDRLLAVNAAPIIDDDGTCWGVLATFDDLTEVEKKNAELERLLHKLENSRKKIRKQNRQLASLATHDPLTGCHNRRSFAEQLDAHWINAIQTQEPLGCLMFDIDHFKSINDTYGHQFGDKVLAQVSKIICEAVRESDFVCRYGGEEFCVILPGLDVESAALAAERVRQRIESEPCDGIQVTVSVGVSARSLGAIESAVMLNQADQALYAAKHSGRNRFICWSDLPGVIGRKKASPTSDEKISMLFHAMADSTVLQTGPCIESDERAVLSVRTVRRSAETAVPVVVQRATENENADRSRSDSAECNKPKTLSASSRGDFLDLDWS